MARQSGMRAVRSGRVGLQALDDGEVLAGGVAGPAPGGDVSLDQFVEVRHWQEGEMEYSFSLNSCPGEPILVGNLPLAKIYLA